MSEILPNKAIRRFLDLQVHEVSLVDTPANEQPFLVAKRQDSTQEENDMPQTAATQAAPNSGDSSGAVRVSVDVNKAENDAVKAAMSQVTALVDGIAKAAGVSLGETEHPEPADVEKAGGFGAMRKMYQSAMKEAGMAGDQLASAMAKFDKKFPPQLMAKTQKNAGEDDSVVATPSVDDTIEATLDTIQKAKAFTPARVAKLAEALETLQKLMMEVIVPGSSPATHVPGVSQHSNPNTTRAALVGTQKSNDPNTVAMLQGLDAVVTRLEEMTTDKDAKVAKRADEDVDVVSTLKNIMNRLDAIEQARPAPHSEGDGTVTTQQTKKNFWGGLI